MILSLRYVVKDQTHQREMTREIEQLLSSRVQTLTTRPKLGKLQSRLWCQRSHVARIQVRILIISHHQLISLSSADYHSSQPTPNAPNRRGLTSRTYSDTLSATSCFSSLIFTNRCRSLLYPPAPSPRASRSRRTGRLARDCVHTRIARPVGPRDPRFRDFCAGHIIVRTQNERRDIILNIDEDIGRRDAPAGLLVLMSSLMSNIVESSVSMPAYPPLHYYIYVLALFQSVGTYR